MAVGLRRRKRAIETRYMVEWEDEIRRPAGRIQGSTLAVWEVMLLFLSYKKNVSAVAAHLKWPKVKVQAAVHYAEAFPEEINAAMAENDATNFEKLKRMLPQAIEFVPKKEAKN